MIRLDLLSVCIIAILKAILFALTMNLCLVILWFLSVGSLAEDIDSYASYDDYNLPVTLNGKVGDHLELSCMYCYEQEWYHNNNSISRNKVLNFKLSASQVGIYRCVNRFRVCRIYDVGISDPEMQGTSAIDDLFNSSAALLKTVEAVEKKEAYNTADLGLNYFLNLFPITLSKPSPSSAVSSVSFNIHMWKFIIVFIVLLK